MSFDSSRSANSGGKSKRILDSNSTNLSHRTNSNNNNKRKPNQKTLGMAWGASSLSSSKSSSRRSPFTDFGSYMVEKNKKLRNQFDADASSSSLGNSDSNSAKPLFHGVSIFVDGFTVPSSQELRGYMLKYGGRFENYFSRHRVTHIICSNLPDSKIKNLRSFSGGLPVVKPTWVLDCVVANKLLNWFPYQLDQFMNETYKQPKLSAFFALKSNSTSEDSKTPSNCNEKSDIEDSLPKGSASKETTDCKMGESIKYRMECSGEIVLGHEKPSGVIKQEPPSIDENFLELRMAKSSSTDVKDEVSVKVSFQSSPQRSSASANNCSFDNQNTKGSSVPRTPSTSTLGDPNFVENYFKNSRLHFIGTWRNRYRKRFPSLPNMVKCGDPTVTAPTVPQKSAIIHVDMDCFFVSVIIRNHPELQDKPVAVCHSDNPRGTAEISSANYPARDYGVRSGIFVRDAKALCPHLVIVPYNFEAYEEVADQFYEILHKHCKKVQAVSCDEAFLDVSDREDKDPEHIASIIRQEIVETTGCTASAGIAGNLLIARLATRTAKPNSQCFIPPEKVDIYLNELPIKALPGIGHVLEEKLKKRHIQTCGQLCMISKESLQMDFGTKTGNMLWNYCRGIDNRQVGVVQETKSVGAEVNWGVRFNDLTDSQHFLVNLCKEVYLRLQGCGVQGRTITMKVKKRRKDADEPTKYMGCGECENLSRSVTVPIATDDVDVLQRISNQLFGSFHIDVKEIRGVGLQVSRLENADITRQGHEKNALTSWLASASANTKEPSYPAKGRVDGDHQLFNINSTSHSHQMQTNQSSGEACLSRDSTLPPICHLDMGVIECLPPEIFSEVNEMYGGKLFDFVDKNKDKGDRVSRSVCTTSTEEVEGARRKGKEPLLSHQVDLDNTTTENKSVSCSGAGSSNLHITTVGADRTDVMPASLSQVDVSVLQQLPYELKVDILELLPAHRRSECSSDGPIDITKECPRDTVRMKNNKEHMEDSNSFSRNSLWMGNPPEWVEKFEVSNHLILNFIVEMYYKSGSTGLLSSILQSAISAFPFFLASNDGGDEAISFLCELLQQYIELKIKSDIEEIYICFRLLRRFTVKSSFFLQVYDIVLPYLQASVGENYGGNLNI